MSDPDPLLVNEDVSAVRIDVWPIAPPKPSDHPDHYEAITLDVETIDHYGRLVSRTTLKLSPYTAKQLVERIHLALDAAKHGLGP